MSNQLDLMLLLHMYMHVITACSLPQLKLMKIGYFFHGLQESLPSFALDGVLSNTVNRSTEKYRINLYHSIQWHTQALTHTAASAVDQENVVYSMNHKIHSVSTRTYMARVVSHKIKILWHFQNVYFTPHICARGEVIDSVITVVVYIKSP